MNNNSSKTWTAKEAIVVQKELKLTSNKRDSLLKFVRLHGEKVEPYVREKIRAEKAQLHEFYKTSIVEFQSISGEPMLRPMTYTDEPNNLLNFVDGERQKAKDDSKEIPMVRKAGIDSGKGFLKLMTTSMNIDINDEPPVKKSKVRKADGVVGSDRKQCSGEKIIPLAVVPDVPETYHNLKIIVQLCRLSELNLVFTGDLKVYNIMLGQFKLIFYV